MMGSQVNKDAPNILGLIPVNSVGAEIGVWFGNSSQIFLNKGIKISIKDQSQKAT